MPIANFGRGALLVSSFGLAILGLGGGLAGLLPQLDMINHFRPGLTALLLLLMALAISCNRGWPNARHQRALLAMVASNVILFMQPLPLLPALIVAEAGPVERLDLIDANLLVSNHDWARIERMLIASPADIVTLQEVTPAFLAALPASVVAAYPHRATCPGRCDVAVFSRRPIEVIACRAPEVARADMPPCLAVRWRSPAGRLLTIVTAHTATPMAASKQRRQVVALARSIAQLPQPLLLAGDLNATPWSWTVQHLRRSANLEPQAVFLRSWPTGFWHPPYVLIDHVMASLGLRAETITLGAPFGSDHLPVRAQLDLGF